MQGFVGLISLIAAAPATVPLPPEIIVLGEKRIIPLQKTTTSVAVYTDKEIDDRSLRDVQELYNRTANVAPAFGASAFSIRGIVNFGVTGGGEASTSTVYLDGIPMASTFLQAAPTQLWDMARVEILRGPQSTLQGINALAGAVILKSSDPSHDRWTGSARAVVTSETQSRLSAAMGGPVASDQLAFRISADTSSRDGYIWNATRNGAEDKERSAVIRGALAWKPTNWAGFEARLSYVHAERNGPYYTVYTRTDRPDFLQDRVATDNVANTTELKFDGLSLNAQYRLSDAISVANESTWSHVRETSQFDGDYGPSNLAFSNQQRTYQTFTQELKAIVDRPALKGVAGLYFYARDLASQTTSRTAVPTPISTISAFLRNSGASAPVADAIARAYGNALPAVNVDFSGSFPTYVRSYAAFGDARVRFLPRVSILVGFRASHEVNETQTIQRSTFAGTYPDPAGFAGLAPVVAQINSAVGGLVSQANGTLPDSRRTFDSFLPKAGVAIDFSETIEAALVVQKAYRSGGTSGNIARGQVAPYDPENTWNYEASFRSLLLGGRLRFNANAFYVDWRQQQVAVNFGLNAYDVQTVNAGKSHLYGFEMESDYQIQAGWSAYLALGHTRTKFDQFVVPGLGTTNTLTGTEFAFAPRWTVSLGSDVRLSSRWGGSLNASYASRSFGATGANQANYRVAPHALVNGRLGYDARTWSVHTVFSNLLDRRYVIYKSPAESRAIVNAPRTVGIELAARY